MGNEGSTVRESTTPVANDVKFSWRCPTGPGNLEGDTFLPLPREGHVAATVGDCLYVFGGSALQPDKSLEETNELFIYSAETGRWQQVTTKGSKPSPRTTASMTAVGNKLYVFGGLSHTTGWLSDLHCFDTETRKWSHVEAKGAAPSPRDKASCVTIGNVVYLFGGFGPQDDDDDERESDDELPDDQQGLSIGWFKDIFTFDTESCTWAQPLQMNLKGPTPRAAAGVCALGSKLVVFGGRDQEGRQNDLYFFETVSRTWEQVKTRGRTPPARSFHTASCVGGGQPRLVVYGGRSASNEALADLHVLHTETGTWLEPEQGGEVPASGRALHVAAVVKDTLVVFGGSSGVDATTGQSTGVLASTLLVPTAELVQGGPTEDLTAPESSEASSGNGSKTPQQETEAGEHPTPPKVRKTDEEQS